MIKSNNSGNTELMVPVAGMISTHFTYQSHLILTTIFHSGLMDEENETVTW